MSTDTAPKFDTAEDVLRNFKQIVENERLIRGSYVTPAADGDPKAICNGHRMCAMGTLAVAAGFFEKGFGVYNTAGIFDSWGYFKEELPVARPVLGFLEQAIDEYEERTPTARYGVGFETKLESFFESLGWTDVNYPDGSMSVDAHTEAVAAYHDEGRRRLHDAMSQIADRAIELEAAAR